MLYQALFALYSHTKKKKGGGGGGGGRNRYMIYQDQSIDHFRTYRVSHNRLPGATISCCRATKS